MSLTQEQLRSLLNYNPETGVFTWLIRTSANPDRYLRAWNARFAGKLAGGIWRSKDGVYWRIVVLGRLYLAHRLAWLYMTGAWPVIDIDHRNRDGLNNRWRNLRLATRSQNNANSDKPANNTSGFKGVSFHKSTKRYRARVHINGKHIHLGLFDTPEEAARAYDTAANDTFGDFALLNFPSAP